MPPRKKINKEEILKISLEILKKEPLENINARRLAKELNCSVQPIFYNFKNMEELKREALNAIYRKYQEALIEASNKSKAYKEMGLAYIRFAKEYPNYFKIIFMGNTNQTCENIIDQDNNQNGIIQKGMELTGFTYEQQKEFHIKVWIFTHGIATLVATNTVRFKEDEIEKLLKDTVREMIRGSKKG